ncbi:MAG: hypothetical protein HC892_01625 [Saprospiraceae bacterium]|nr:hypothetical protein [Saprospiraceae bacterium]
MANEKKGFGKIIGEHLPAFILTVVAVVVGTTAAHLLIIPKVSKLGVKVAKAEGEE